MIVYNSSIVRDGLVLHLDAANIKSYPGSGLVVNDLSANKYSGILENGASFNSGNLGSFVFDGVNDNINFGDILDLGTNSLTVNQWVNLSSKISTNMYTLSKARALNEPFRYGTNFEATTGRIRAFFSDIIPIGTTVTALNTWYMATWVFDRVSNIKMYLNAKEEIISSGSSNISSLSTQNFQNDIPFRVGSYSNADSSPAIGFPGKIGLTQVYFRVLSESEIRQNFEATRGRYGI